MDTFIELLVTAGKFLVGLWPIMFLAVLVGIAKRKKGFREVLRTSIKALMFAWAFFAVLNLVFAIFKVETFFLLPEEINKKAFLAVGLLLAPLEFAVLLDEHHRLIDAETIEEMRNLSASQFEKLVAQTYRAQGHQVEEVGATGDHGIDLVIHTRKGETWIVQCKKYRGKVGEPVIRDFYGALRASNADAGAVITSGSITAQARLWAEGKPIYLYDGEEFLKIIETTRIRRNLPLEVFKKPTEDKPAAIPSMQPAFAGASPSGSAPIVRPLNPDTVQSASQVADAVVAESSTAAQAPVKRVSMPVTRSTSSSVHFPSFMHKDPDAYPSPDKRPFMDLNPAPDCPACGLPMILTEQKRPFLKPKEIYICQNAPSCEETHEVE